MITSDSALHNQQVFLSLCHTENGYFPLDRTNMKQTVLYIITAVLLLSACSPSSKRPDKVKTPDHIISHDEMVAILVDYHLAESTLKYYTRYGPETRQLADKIYDTVMEKHHINRKQFRNSMDFYSAKPERMRIVYADVMEKLSSIQSQVRANE